MSHERPGCLQSSGRPRQQRGCDQGVPPRRTFQTSRSDCFCARVIRPLAASPSSRSATEGFSFVAKSDQCAFAFDRNRRSNSLPAIMAARLGEPRGKDRVRGLAPRQDRRNAGSHRAGTDFQPALAQDDGAVPDLDSRYVSRCGPSRWAGRALQARIVVQSSMFQSSIVNSSHWRGGTMFLHAGHRPGTG